MRTYERGVEAETGACGTGAVSTAIVCNLKYGINFPIIIVPTSQSEVKVNILYKENIPYCVEYTGKVTIIKKIIHDTF